MTLQYLIVLKAMSKAWINIAISYRLKATSKAWIDIAISYRLKAMSKAWIDIAISYVLKAMSKAWIDIAISYRLKAMSKAWIDIGLLSEIWKSDLSDYKREFFFTLWSCHYNWIEVSFGLRRKGLVKMLGVNCARMLCAILNKSGKKHCTKQKLYGQLLPISQTIQVK